MKHNCCVEAVWFLEYDAEDNAWSLSNGGYYVAAEFCPWCGEKLPIESPLSVKIGDYVVKTKSGEIRILPQEADGHDGIQYAKITDILIGRIGGLGDYYEDHWVIISSGVHCPYKAARIRVIESLKEWIYKPLKPHMVL